MKMSTVLFSLATFALAASLIPTARAADDAQEEQGVLRHVVLFEFKEGTSAEKVAEIERAFAALPEKIPQIAEFEWGTNNSPEGLDRGLTHCFLVTFNSAADRDAYLPHPEHKKFVELLLPHLEEAVVVDYFAR
jgi:hypothetical protein